MCPPLEPDRWMDCVLQLKTSSTLQDGIPVVVIQRGAIRIRQQWRTPYAWSNFCGPAPAASAKRFVTNWPSAFSVRITFTARLLTHAHPIACRVVRRADLLPRWHVV